MERIEFDADDAPEVLTGISPECQAERCAACSGFFRVNEHGDEPVFCIHDCHKVTVSN